MKSNPNEIFDVVDSSDNVLYQEKRSIIHQNNLIHRASHIILLDENKNILLQKRASSKDSYPLIYTTSTSGHVDAGENYLQAAIREAFEELGIQISQNDLTPIGKIYPCPETANEFTFLYTLIYNQNKMGPLNFPKDEVDSLKWIPLKEFSKQINLFPENFTPSFLKVFHLFSNTTNT